MNTIETTISVSGDLFNRVQIRNKNDTKKISRFIQKAATIAIRQHSSFHRCGRVRYQKMPESFRRVHLRIPSAGYELLTDARSSAKLSVSLMIASALESMLNEKIKTNSDSYPNYIYDIRFETSNFWNITIIRWKNTA